MLLSKIRLLVHFMVVVRALITRLSEISVICNMLVDRVLLVRIFIVAFVSYCGGIRLLFKKACDRYSLLGL